VCLESAARRLAGTREATPDLAPDRSTILDAHALERGTVPQVEIQSERMGATPTEADTSADGRTPCPDCGRRFRPRGLATHRRQAHGEHSTQKADVAGGFEALSGLVAEVTAHLVRMDRRMGLIEAALVGDAERRSRTREVPHDVVELQGELDAVLAEIRSLTDALCDEPVPDADQPMRGRLGVLRQRQAAILFRMGPSAPGGVFPPGDNALLQR
jgi:hypothetical protein